MDLKTKAIELIQLDNELSKSSNAIYKAYKNNEPGAREAWVDHNNRHLVNRIEMRDTFGSDNLRAYLVASKPNQLNALMTGVSNAPRYHYSKR